MEMVELARTIDRPGYFIKLCGSSDELRSVMPSGWRLDLERYFMTGRQASTSQPLPKGYTIEIEQSGMIRRVAIRCETGDLAASGHAAEIPSAFIYDRIETALAHRRKGLGRIVMASLARTKYSDVPELLVATNEGRLLYEALGWHVLSPYATASIPCM
ncbi:N-acetyltransferase [Altererythrobacter indicus]|uniref:N-acetyltransferase n=1 Tax=Altericroceibacterium indicum TaxID=374177 RepID=A0A845A8I7_9SPHN|nr:N-acetyltransferase [Altericroceibacterium indicum]MXP25135.1 N-acetyltransferase [Altericroceibacterium indicum]